MQQAQQLDNSLQGHNVLALDMTGQPFKWIGLDDACFYYATDSVLYDLGDSHVVYRGGWNKKGDRSEIVVKSILAIKGADNIVRKQHDVVPMRQNELLFRRDHNLCAYCGQVYVYRDLTRDHVKPRSHGGSNKWENMVTACFGCNQLKADRTPEQAGMKLLYVPYRPNRFEHFILQNRRILADQMEYLKANLPKHSRWLNA
jgi:hypothetical protein